MAPTTSPYPQFLAGFLKAGFAVVATDYIGLGMPGVHPYLVGKSEGAAVLAAALAAQNFAPAQAWGPVIIYGHSQGGHAALYADWQAQHISYFAPGVDVQGVIATAPPTFLNRIASSVLADPTNRGAVMNLLIAAGSWHRLYQLDYPGNVITKKGQEVADLASNPDTAGCYSLPQVVSPADLVRPGDLPVAWTDWLGINTAPVGLLPKTTPLLIVQGTSDEQVPYPVTLAAVRDICNSGVPVTFYSFESVNHAELLTNEKILSLIVMWAQDVVGGESPEDTCGSLP